VSKFKPADRDRLSELLVKELEIFERIRKLTEKQAELLAKDDVDQFDGSLDKRQELIEKINGLHQESDPLMQSYVSSPADEKCAEIEDLREKIRETVGICAGLNDKIVAEMKVKSKEHSEKIDRHSAKRKGIGGYAQAVPNTPEVFDTKT